MPVFVRKITAYKPEEALFYGKRSYDFGENLQYSAGKKRYFAHSDLMTS